jgi:Domain of unknown function (DUF4333)
MKVARSTMLALAAGIAVSGCSVFVGPNQVDRVDVAQRISTQLQTQVGRPPDAVACPANLDAKVGAALTCTLTDRGVSYDATVTVTSVDGGDVAFNLKVGSEPKK